MDDAVKVTLTRSLLERVVTRVNGHTVETAQALVRQKVDDISDVLSSNEDTPTSFLDLASTGVTCDDQLILHTTKREQAAAEALVEETIHRLLLDNTSLIAHVCDHQANVLNCNLDTLQRDICRPVNVTLEGALERLCRPRVYNIIRCARRVGGRRRMQIRKGSMTQDLDLQAVVNSANSRLLPNGGAALAISQACGTAYDAACAESVRAFGRLRVADDVRCTPSFSLAQSRGSRLAHVLHVVAPTHGEAPQSQLLEDMYVNILNKARDQDIRSVTMCAIACGAGGTQPSVSAEALFRAADVADPDGCFFDTIRVSIIPTDAATLQAYVDTFDRFYAASGAASHYCIEPSSPFTANVCSSHDDDDDDNDDAVDDDDDGGDGPVHGDFAGSHGSSGSSGSSSSKGSKKSNGHGARKRKQRRRRRKGGSDGGGCKFVWSRTRVPLKTAPNNVNAVVHHLIPFAPEAIPLIDSAFSAYCKRHGTPPLTMVDRVATTPPFGQLGTYKDSWQMSKEAAASLRHHPVISRHVAFYNRDAWKDARFFRFKIQHTTSTPGIFTWTYYIIDFQDMWVYQVTDPNILNLTTSSATTTNDGDDDIVLAYALHCSPFHLPSNLPTAIDMESDAVRAALTEEPFPLCRDERTDEHRAREFVYSLCGPVDMVKECKQRIDRFLQERVRTLTLALSGSTSVDVDAIQDLCDSQGVYMRVLLSDPSYTLLLHGDADAVESVRCDIVSTCNASSPPTTSVVGSPRMQRAHPPSSAPTRHGGYTHHQAGLHAYPHTASSADTDGAMMAAMAVEQLHAVTVDSATPDTFDAFLALAQTVPGYYDCSQDIEGEDDATTFVFRFQSREGAWQMHTLCNSLKRCELGVATS